MKTIFERETRDALVERIGKINDNSQAQWGKMNRYQMVKHIPTGTAGYWEVKSTPTNRPLWVGYSGKEC